MGSFSVLWLEKALEPTGSGMTHGKFPKGQTVVSLLSPHLSHGLGSLLILGSDFLISSWVFHSCEGH